MRVLEGNLDEERRQRREVEGRLRRQEAENLDLAQGQLSSYINTNYFVVSFRNFHPFISSI